MKTLRIVLGLLLLFVAAGAGIVYSGVYNVAASKPPAPVTQWVLQRTTERSVAVRADNEEPMPEFVAPDPVRLGARDYAENCEICHGAPGVLPRGIARGLTPQPPDLAEAVTRWKPEELFWIVKHGIKMTGMPAWGESHSDEELWAITAFIQLLPEMTPEEYREMVPSVAACAPAAADEP